MPKAKAFVRGVLVDMQRAEYTERGTTIKLGVQGKSGRIYRVTLELSDWDMVTIAARGRVEELNKAAARIKEAAAL